MTFGGVDVWYVCVSGFYCQLTKIFRFLYGDLFHIEGEGERGNGPTDLRAGDGQKTRAHRVLGICLSIETAIVIVRSQISGMNAVFWEAVRWHDL